MSDNDPQFQAAASALPRALFGLAAVFYLVLQLSQAVNYTLVLRQRLAAVRQQTENLAGQVMPAKNAQTFLEALANESLNLAASDADVRRITDRYQIRRVQ